MFGAKKNCPLLEVFMYCVFNIECPLSEVTLYTCICLCMPRPGAKV